MFYYRYGCDYLPISGLGQDCDTPSDFAMRMFQSCLEPLIKYLNCICMYIFMRTI